MYSESRKECCNCTVQYEVITIYINLMTERLKNFLTQKSTAMCFLTDLECILAKTVGINTQYHTLYAFYSFYLLYKPLTGSSQTLISARCHRLESNLTCPSAGFFSNTKQQTDAPCRWRPRRRKHCSVTAGID